MNTSKFTILNMHVHRDDGKPYENLVAVFRRVFPIVYNQVLADGKPRTIGYYGTNYTISRD